MISNLELLDRFFECHNSFFEWNRPERGTMTFPKFLLPISINQFTKQLVEKAGILIMRGHTYYARKYLRFFWQFLSYWILTQNHARGSCAL